MRILFSLCLIAEILKLRTNVDSREKQSWRAKVEKWIATGRISAKTKMTRHTLTKTKTKTNNMTNTLDLHEYDLSSELWREYDFGGRVYRICAPITLYLRDGGTTHRVVDDAGTVHCVPAPGRYGCALRWVNKKGEPPVKF
jgi:hypothetical protein